MKKNHIIGIVLLMVASILFGIGISPTLGYKPVQIENIYVTDNIEEVEETQIVKVDSMSFEDMLDVDSYYGSRNYALTYDNTVHFMNLTGKGGYYSGDFFVVRTLTSFGHKRYNVVKETTLHEYGHFLMDFLMTQREESDWIDDFVPDNKSITKYGTKNYKEDWAESYEHVMDFCYDADKIDDLDSDRAEIMESFVSKYWREC